MNRSQAESTTRENLEERFERGEEVLDYFNISRAEVIKQPLSPRHRYSSDRPNKPPAPDLLGRDQFAERLAEDIRCWDGNDSIVIGLFGGWGCGKTSLKERIVACLKKGDPDWPILDFNPWQFSGNGISIPFFRELDVVLKTGQAGKHSEEASRKLHRYSSRLSLLGSIVRFATPLGLLHSTEAATGVAAAAEALKKIAEATQQTGDALEQDVESKTATQIKKELVKAMAELDRPILVVIDDIDRLTTSEILEVFQLVKVNADLPKIIYLLLFDRSVVSKALDKVSEGRGDQYLEKIVQVAYHVPQAHQGSIREILFRGIDEILEANNAEIRWDQNRWADVYLKGMDHYFQNLRHVYRFLASLDFHVRHFRRPDGFEVNPIDLIALETLRVFESSLYEKLFENKSLLVGNEQTRYQKQDDAEERTAAFAYLMRDAHETSRTFASKIIGSIFPLCVRGGDSTSWGTLHEEQWLRDARICHRDIFERYFTLGIADKDISQIELERLINLASDHEKFCSELKTLTDRGLLEVAMERMDAYKTEIPLKALPELILGLCDYGDCFPEPQQIRRLVFDPLSFAWRLVYFGLKRVKTVAQRLAILTTAFEKTRGLVLPVMIVDHDEQTTERKQKAYEFLIDEDQLVPLKKICVDKLRAAAKDGSLKAKPDAARLLWRWREWTSSDEVRSWTTDQCRNQGAAPWFLSTMLGVVSSGAKRYPYITLSTLEMHVDIDVLNAALEQINVQRLTEREREAVAAFRVAWKRKQQGKPELTGRSLFMELENLDEADEVA